LTLSDGLISDYQKSEKNCFERSESQTCHCINRFLSARIHLFFHLKPVIVFFCFHNEPSIKSISPRYTSFRHIQNQSYTSFPNIPIRDTSHPIHLIFLMSKTDESVKVVVRIRPMSSEELRNGNTASVFLLLFST
jgi:hypothetical protein